MTEWWIIAFLCLVIVAGAVAWANGLLGKATAEPLSYSEEERKIFAATNRIGWTVVLFGLGGVAIVAVWAWGVVGRPPADAQLSALPFLGADLLVALAAAAAGALFGFIFGIPRTLDPASRAAVATAAKEVGPAATSHAVMAANTNLERISDWLTTLLIGATLVQIKDIVAWVGSLGKNLVASGQPANDAVIPIIVIYFFALSFLGVYLITRLYLTSAFQQTLSALAGGEPPPPTGGDVRQKIKSALESGKPEDLKAALAAYDRWNAPGTEGDDAALNADIARILAKLIASGAAATRPAARGELEGAVRKAATDPDSKNTLKEELESKKMTTGDEELDQRIKALVT